MIIRAYGEVPQNLRNACLMLQVSEILHHLNHEIQALVLPGRNTLIFRCKSSNASGTGIAVILT
jgi:hypothetical protein